MTLVHDLRLKVSSPLYLTEQALTIKSFSKTYSDSVQVMRPFKFSHRGGGTIVQSNHPVKGSKHQLSSSSMLFLEKNIKHSLIDTTFSNLLQNRHLFWALTCLLNHRSAVQNQSSDNFYNEHFYCSMLKRPQ